MVRYKSIGSIILFFLLIQLTGCSLTQVGGAVSTGGFEPKDVTVNQPGESVKQEESPGTDREIQNNNEQKDNGDQKGQSAPKDYPTDRLALQPREFLHHEGKIAYLTFDDGPSSNVTPQILKVLKEKDVPATFFVIGKSVEEHPGILQEVYAQGHAIGNHTYSHKYEEIYTNPEALLSNVDKNSDLIEKTIGIRPTIMRTPGGTAAHFNFGYFNLLDQHGYLIYDWNVAAQDAVKVKVSKNEIINNVLHQAANKKRIIVLMHDNKTKETTAQALPAIIDGLRAMGFTFEEITPQVEPIHFRSGLRP